MKKRYYESPVCEAIDMVFENTVLTGSSDAFGDTGMPGTDLEELDPIFNVPFILPDFGGLL